MSIIVDPPPILVPSRNTTATAIAIGPGPTNLDKVSRRSRATHARKARALLAGAMRIVDCLVVLTTAVAAYVMLHRAVHLPLELWLVAGLGALLNGNILFAGQLYTFPSLVAPRWRLAGVLAGWSITALLLLPLIFLTKPPLDKTLCWFTVWTASCGVALVLIRVGLLTMLRHSVIGRSMVLQVIVLGTDRGTSDVANQLRRSSDLETEIEVLFPGDGIHETENDCIDYLLEMTRLGRIDEVVLHWPVDTEYPHQETVLSKLCQTPIDVTLHPATFRIPNVNSPIGSGPLPMLLIHTRPLAACSILKRGMDAILGASLLVAALPLMLVIAITITIDSRGPVLFSQFRFGLGGKSFLVYKFRTMHYGTKSSMTETQASRDDPRVTRVGRFLRRHSIDELPQLFNVCRGEMSLVGPRPHAIAHNEIYSGIIAAYSARHLVKPGITGWAQVNGARGETRTSQAMQKRIEYDLYYIRNWSLMLDIKILFRTIGRIFHDPNAY